MTVVADRGVPGLSAGLRSGDARSWLLVNAWRPDAYLVAAASAADVLILDVEDAVDPRHKPEARTRVLRWLAEGNAAWIRINSAASSEWREDVRALAGKSGVRGVVLAKAESAGEVNATVDAFRVPVVPLVESAIGIGRAEEIAAASGVARLAFGTGDYRRDTGIASSALALSYPRSRLVVASRAAELPGPIDGPSASDASSQIVAEQSAEAIEVGMTGRLCVAPDQARIVNTALSPSEDDVHWATAVIRDFDTREGMIRDGSDLPLLARATKILERAAALGITAELGST